MEQTEFPCPECGGFLEYNEDTDEWNCILCGYSFETGENGRGFPE